jgi:murein DD-endopeptidase MepM/ murein hydrolase activator NlpD
LLALTVVVCGAIPLIAPANAGAVLVSARAGDVSGFSGGIQQVNGTLTAVGPVHGADAQTFAAAYSGTAGGGQASGTFNVSWRQGQSVEYGGAFYLPSNFHVATAGQQALLRWDSSPAADGSVQQGGVVIDYSDNSGYLVADTVINGSPTQQMLVGPFALRVGTWFTLQVRQLLGSGSAAYSDVYLNGRIVAASRAPTLSGTQIGHVSYGIVQLTPDAAQGPVSLDFDQVTAAGYTGYIDPLGGDRYIAGRTDMGVDFCLTPGEPVRTTADGIVVGISPDWFRHQPYIWYQVLDGPYAGRYVYVAEQIKRLAHVGAQLSAGEPLAYYKKSGTCLETGWSAADGSTLAQATTGYTEGQVTRSGVSFAHFLRSLGVQGPFEFTQTPIKRKHPKRPGRKPPHPARG